MRKPKTFERSFESHLRSKNWSEKNEVNPRDVFKSSRKKYWFDCVQLELNHF